MNLFLDFFERFEPQNQLLKQRRDEYRRRFAPFHAISIRLSNIWNGYKRQIPFHSPHPHMSLPHYTTNFIEYY